MFNILATQACTLTSLNNIEVDAIIVKAVSIVYNGIRFGIPILLILFGMLDLGKAVIAQKEDDIKKAQQLFIKRLISAVVVFLIFSIVKIVLGIFADASIFSDINCLISNGKRS